MAKHFHYGWRAMLALTLALVLSGCGEHSRELRLHSLAYQQLNINALEQAFGNDLALDIVPDAAPPDLSALAALHGDFADLTIVENSTPFEPGVRTVIPLYRSVLHLLVRDGLDLLQKRASGEALSVYVVNDSNAGRTFLDLAVDRAGLLIDKVEVVSEVQPGITDAILYFGPINPQSTSWYQDGYHLVSLADAGEATEEFMREGVVLLVPQMHAMEIPALTYRLPGNERPLQSLSVATLLVARQDAPEDLIYQLASNLVRQKAHFAALEPDVFSWISEHFDKEKLNFPLHAGARRYFDRDEPGLLERYADTISLLVYLAILLATGLLAFVRWRAQRKKDRVDTFYVRLLDIRERSHSEAPSGLLEEVAALEIEAYRLLVAEKLAADESFRIFTDLLTTIREELRRL